MKTRVDLDSDLSISIPPLTYSQAMVFHTFLLTAQDGSRDLKVLTQIFGMVFQHWFEGSSEFKHEYESGNVTLVIDDADNRKFIHYRLCVSVFQYDINQCPMPMLTPKLFDVLMLLFQHRSTILSVYDPQDEATIAMEKVIDDIIELYKDNGVLCDPIRATYPLYLQSVIG